MVLPVLSDGGFRVELFDAADVGRGPVATLASPNHECVPVVLHSAWMPRAVDPVAHDRLRFADELDEDRLRALDPALAEVARSVAADLDDELAV